MLELTDISASIQGSRILRGVNLQVPDHSLACLMGRNGVGKTTTLKSIVGLIKPDTGTMQFDGLNLTVLKPEDRARQGVAYVPQGRDIFPNLTVSENLKISLVIHGAKANGQVDRVLQLFPILKEMLQRKGGVLSGGQQQQLAIARALVSNPRVLVLDEPTEGIQPSIIKDIARALKEIRQLRKLAIVVSEQVVSFMMDVCDRALVIERGRFIHEAPRAGLDAAKVKSLLSV